MQIGILIFSKPKDDGFTNVQSLEKAADRLGHKITRLYEPFFTLQKNSSEVELLYENKSLPKLDVIIARPNFCEEPGLHRVVIEQLVADGNKVVNGGKGIFIAKNKLQQHVILTKAGIPMPEWKIVEDAEQARQAVKQMGFPCIIKVAFGTHGTGVFYAENLETFSPIVDYLSVRDKNPIIIQKFVREANHKDVRVLVAGNKIVASMERTAPENEIRSNIAKGGTGKATVLSNEEEKVAISATQALGLDIAGVDILRSNNGPLVIEVNANPGFAELEIATNIDIAGEIINFSSQS